MHCLNRNKTKIFYALFTGEVENTNSEGNYTGERSLTYGTPVAFYANVSAARGTADVEQFGINADYTKVIVTCDMSCPIKEDSIIWIDKPVTERHNYAVTQIARSLNSISIAVKELSTA